MPFVTVQPRSTRGATCTITRRRSSKFEPIYDGRAAPVDQIVDWGGCCNPSRTYPRAQPGSGDVYSDYTSGYTQEHSEITTENRQSIRSIISGPAGNLVPGDAFGVVSDETRG